MQTDDGKVAEVAETITQGCQGVKAETTDEGVQGSDADADIPEPNTMSTVLDSGNTLWFSSDDDADIDDIIKEFITFIVKEAYRQLLSNDITSIVVDPIVAEVE